MRILKRKNGQYASEFLLMPIMMRIQRRFMAQTKIVAPPFTTHYTSIFAGFMFLWHKKKKINNKQNIFAYFSIQLLYSYRAMYSSTNKYADGNETSNWLNIIQLWYYNSIVNGILIEIILKINKFKCR